MFGREYVSGTVQQVRQARPKGAIDAFVKICERWRLLPHDQIVLLGYKTSLSVGLFVLLGPSLGLSQDVKDRTGYVVGISIGLGAIFDESLEAELDWLNTPHPKLANETPLSHMLHGRMINLITVASLVADERGLND
jgi:hypothetical protein